MTPAAAAWIREHVLVRSARSCGVLAGGPCACNVQEPCGSCQIGRHETCDGYFTIREKGVYGPGLAWPPRSQVWTSGPECLAHCACRVCYRPRPPQQLGRPDQLSLFG